MEHFNLTTAGRRDATCVAADLVNLFVPQITPSPPRPLPDMLCNKNRASSIEGIIVSAVEAPRKCKRPLVITAKHMLILIANPKQLTAVNDLQLVPCAIP